LLLLLYFGCQFAWDYRSKKQIYLIDFGIFGSLIGSSLDLRL
jgi:hypothetical protein